MRLVLTFRGGIEADVLSALATSGDLEVGGVLVSEDAGVRAHGLFPDSPLHQVEDLIRKGLAGTFEGVDLRLLTPEFLKATVWAEPIALWMMDRIDVQRSFTYKQRLDLFRYLLCYWRGVVEQDDLHAFYSRETPHEVADYALLVVMKALGREMRMFAWTSIPGRWLLTDDYRHPRTIFAPPRGNGAEGFSDALYDEIVQPLRGAYEAAKPSFMEDVPIHATNTSEAGPSVVEALSRSVASTVALGLNGARSAVRTYRQPAREAYPRMPQTLSTIGSAWQVSHDAKRLGEVYEQVATSVPGGLQYVYYLLGYQPENTNCPEGGELCNQLLAISLLAESLPDGWELVVKEHPAQLMNDGRGVGDYGFLGRDTSFYTAVAGIPGVRLASLTTDHFATLDAAQAISTLTGTVGWEASARGKPVLCLGEAWYEGAPNVFTVHDHATCSAAYDRIAAGDLLRDELLESALHGFVRGIYESSHEVVFDEVDGRNNGITYNEFVQRPNLERIFRAQFCDRT